MPTKTATDLIAEFRADWNAALSPCASCLLARCPEGEREALALLLDDALTEMPSPPYSPVQRRRLEERVAPIVERAMNDPAVIAAFDQQQAAWRDLPRRVRAWRRARSIIGWRLLAWKARRRPAPWE